MPRISTRTGFQCPRPKCGGKMCVKISRPSTSGRIVFRTRCCRKCGLKLESREVAPDFDRLARDLEPFDADKPMEQPRKRPKPMPVVRKRRVLELV